VLAEDPYAAEDAAELIAIGYEELPVVLELPAAERAAELEMGYGDVEVAFANAAHVTRAEFTIGRHSAVPLETRGLLAAPRDGRLEIWGTTKVPHFNRGCWPRCSGSWADPLHTAAQREVGVRGEFCRRTSWCRGSPRERIDR
jgi:carbon-monoxide dehydrogenase large subunit/6-hydroxypseudooxynicotine dehydrogenase subunit gamma